MSELKMLAQQGWQCPVCRRIYSPTTPMCYTCHGECATINTGAETGINATGKAKIPNESLCKDGIHDKVYAPWALASFPPQYQWICRRCGIEGTEREQLPSSKTGIGGTFSNEYEAVKKKFKSQNT